MSSYNIGQFRQILSSGIIAKAKEKQVFGRFMLQIWIKMSSNPEITQDNFHT